MKGREMAERKQKTAVPRKQSSVQLNELTERQVKFLTDRGHGSLTEIVREAVNILYLLELKVIDREVVQQ